MALVDKHEQVVITSKPDTKRQLDSNVVLEVMGSQNVCGV